MSEGMSDQISEVMSDLISGKMSKDQTSEVLSDLISGKMSESMSDQISEGMPD